MLERGTHNRRHRSRCRRRLCRPLSYSSSRRGRVTCHRHRRRRRRATTGGDRRGSRPRPRVSVSSTGSASRRRRICVDVFVNVDFDFDFDFDVRGRPLRTPVRRDTPTTQLLLSAPLGRAATLEMSILRGRVKRCGLEYYLRANNYRESVLGSIIETTCSYVEQYQVFSGPAVGLFQFSAHATMVAERLLSPTPMTRNTTKPMTSISSMASAPTFAFA